MTQDEARALIASKLQPGERSIWAYVLAPWAAARPHLFMLGFGVIWATLSLPALKASLPKFVGGPVSVTIADALLSMVFVAIGIGMTIGALKVVRNGWRTAYGLTDRRLLVAIAPSGKVMSYAASVLSSMKGSGDNHRGTIRFDYGLAGEGFDFRASLAGIANPARVEHSIDETLLEENAGEVSR